MTFTMPRSSFAQQQRLGYEGETPGTLVACHRRLGNIHFKVKANPEMSRNRGPGYKINNLVFPNRIWSTFGYEGPVAYDELTWILAGVIGRQGLGTPPAPSSGHQWVMQATLDQLDIPATYSMEIGDQSYCDSLTCALLTDMTLSMAPAALKVSGSGIGQQLTRGATPTTSGLSLYGSHKAQSNQVKAFTANTWDAVMSGVGATTMVNLKSAELTIPKRWGPDWVLDSDYTSYKGPVELPTEPTVKLKMQHNAASYAFLDQLYAGSKKWVMIQCMSPELVTGMDQYGLVLSLPFQVDDASEPDDVEGVWSMEWPLSPAVPADSDAQFWLQAALTNGCSAL